MGWGGTRMYVDSVAKQDERMMKFALLQQDYAFGERIR
jgi:hypothetical protein